MVKNWNFGQKLKFWSKIKIVVKNWNCGQKLKFWSKIEILVKNFNVGQNLNVGQKLKFSSKIQSLVKNWNFDQKLKFWSKIEILIKNCNAKKYYWFCVIQPFFAIGNIKRGFGGHTTAWGRFGPIEEQKKKNHKNWFFKTC